MNKETERTIAARISDSLLYTSESVDMQDSGAMGDFFEALGHMLAFHLVPGFDEGQPEIPVLTPEQVKNVLEEALLPYTKAPHS